MKARGCGLILAVLAILFVVPLLWFATRPDTQARIVTEDAFAVASQARWCTILNVARGSHKDVVAVARLPKGYEVRIGRKLSMECAYGTERFEMLAISFVDPILRQPATGYIPAFAVQASFAPSRSTFVWLLVAILASVLEIVAIDRIAWFGGFGANFPFGEPGGWPRVGRFGMYLVLMLVIVHAMNLIEHDVPSVGRSALIMLGFLIVLGAAASAAFISLAARRRRESLGM